MSEIKIPKLGRLNCETATGLWYFDHFTETEHPPAVYKKFVEEAEKRIWVWDPYVREGDEILFKDVKKEVDVRVLTSGRFTANVPKQITEFTHSLSHIQRKTKFILELRIYNTRDDEDKVAFHDRYLFVDDHVYSVGSSIQYHRRRISSTSIHQIIHADAKELIEKKFIDLWKHKNTTSTLSLIGGQL